VSEVPVFPEVVIGFRQWLSFEDMLNPLFTCTLSQPWSFGVNTAACHKSDRNRLYNANAPQGPPGHSAPHIDCSCGIYARHEVTETMRRDHIKGRVTGAVMAWGDIMVHRDGFRAEKVKVVALSETTQISEALLQRLASNYGVPIVPLELLALEASQYGSVIPVRPPSSSTPSPEGQS
jgi:hypothetical protein